MTAAGAVLTAAGVILVGIPAVLVPALVGVRGRAAYVTAALVVAAADIVAVVTLLSFVDAFERPWLLAGHAVFAAVALGAWDRLGRPRPPEGLRPQPRAIAEEARRHPVVAVAVGVAGVALAIQLYLGIAVAQTNWDVLSYHLSRAAYWLQYDSATQFPGGSVRQLGYQPDAEILQAWTMDLAGGDRLVALVQWLSAIGTGLACFVAARFLGFPRSGAAFAAALLVAMPMTILQTTTAQNDLVVSFFLLAAVALAMRGVRDQHVGELAVAGAAFGLAVGTKSTALMGVPAVALVLGAVLMRHRPPRRILLVTAACGVAGVVALGSYNYVSNFRNTGHVTGTASDHLERESPVKANAVRIFWGFFDFPGASLPWVDNVLALTAPTVLGDHRNETFGYRSTRRQTTARARSARSACCSCCRSWSGSRYGDGSRSSSAPWPSGRCR